MLERRLSSLKVVRLSLVQATVIWISCWTGSALAGDYSALVVEPESERVLYEFEPDALRHPASLTKMMTLYLVFEALARGRISLHDTLWASRHCTTRPPSKLGLKNGDPLTVEQGILALVTQSANDAASAIAEGLAGSEPAFAEVMTRKAHQLGMTRTVFRNASGLPDPMQVTTAWDMFRLGKALVKQFPQYYTYFSTSSFEFGGRTFRNHNHLLDRYYGADGIKTGFINSSGFNLVASARRDGQRLIGVVFGGRTARQRDDHMQEILDDGFGQLNGLPARTYLATREKMLPAALFKHADDDPALLTGMYRDESFESARPARSEKPHAREPKSSPWQIRLGEFTREQAAEQQVSRARKLTPSAFRQGRVAITAHQRRGQKLYVAYVTGMSRDEAGKTCQVLKRNRVECATAPANG